MFGDLYDSTEGGPHLIEEFQTHWGYERIAQMQRIAVQRMNYIGNYGNPPTTWSVGTSSSSSSDSSALEVTRSDGSTFIQYASASSSGSTGVPDAMAGLSVVGTYVECLRHFRDSYTELPNRPGMDVTYTDRRDYFSRWGGSLQQEEKNFEQMVKSAKRSLLSMSRGSLLGRWGHLRRVGLRDLPLGHLRRPGEIVRFYPRRPSHLLGCHRSLERYETTDQIPLNYVVAKAQVAQYTRVPAP